MTHLKTYEGLLSFLKRKKIIQFTDDECNLLKKFETKYKPSIYGSKIAICVDKEYTDMDEPLSISDKINRKIYKGTVFCDTIWIEIQRLNLYIKLSVKKVDGGFILDAGDTSQSRAFDGVVGKFISINDICDQVKKIILQCKIYICFTDRPDLNVYNTFEGRPLHAREITIDKSINFSTLRNLLNDFSVTTKDNKVSKFRFKSLLEELIGDECRVWNRHYLSNTNEKLYNDLVVLIDRMKRMDIDIVD